MQVIINREGETYHFTIKIEEALLRDDDREMAGKKYERDLIN